MALPNWTLLNVCKRSLFPGKRESKTQLLRRALDSGIRRIDGSTSEKPWRSRHVRIVRPLVIAGVYLLLLAACSVTVHPDTLTATPPVETEAHLVATATAVAPDNARLRERLAQECEWYGECDGPSRWDAIVLALEQRPLRLPVLAPSDACPETPDRWVEGFRYELVGDGPVYGLALHMEVVRADESYFPAHDGWYWSKVVWARDLQYPGPFVIRGRQLNGPEIIRFEQFVPGGPSGPTPEHVFSSLHYPPYTTRDHRGIQDSPGWEDIGSYVVVRTPGCYGVQIDGIGFSTVIVFAVPVPETNSQ